MNFVSKKKTQNIGLKVLIIGILILVLAYVGPSLLSMSIVGHIDTPTGSASIESSGPSELFIGLSILVIAVGIVILMGATYFGLDFTHGKTKLKLKAKK